MSQKIGRLSLILLCVGLLTGFIYIDSKNESEGLAPEISYYLGEETITAWNNGEIYYLFLPSYANASDVVLTPYSMEFEVVGEELLIVDGTDLTNLAFDEVYSCRNIENSEAFSLCIMKSENLPTVFVETDSGKLEEIHADKRIEENGKMQIFSKTGEKVFAGGLTGMKGRGNHTFNSYAKKSYSLTTKEEVSLLELGVGTKYVLLSNASDPTLIRNHIVRTMEKELETEYENIGRFVDVYINGEYQGNYYLCESIEIGSDRIAVTDLEEQMDRIYHNAKYESLKVYETDTKRARIFEENPQDITGGYLVEREFEQRYQSEYALNPSSFITPGEERFIVKSPLYCSAEQIDYLYNCFSEAEAAILAKDGINAATGKSYDEYIDLDSFVKKYLVEEVIKNYDAGVTSTYYYKDSDKVDGRIKAAPVWDCDMSLGNYIEWMEYFSEDPTGITKMASREGTSKWYAALYDKFEFYEKICQQYKEKLSPYMQELTEHVIDEQRSILFSSAKMNEIRWEEDFSNIVNYNNQDASFNSLKEFIDVRREYLDSAWCN